MSLKAEKFVARESLRKITMREQYYVRGHIPERFVEVDAARLLLIIAKFAKTSSEEHYKNIKCRPTHNFVAYFTPEYYLHKLDFLLRYPHYFIYELTELFRMGIILEQKREELLNIARKVISTNEPELMTQHFRKFWYGAYERLDDVEAWWHSRELIYTGLEPRGQSRPWKYYFITTNGLAVANRMITEVLHAKWYADRISLLYTYFGNMSPTKIKELQYKHEAYNQAQLHEHIPDLSLEEIENHFTTVFGEKLRIEIGA